MLKCWEDEAENRPTFTEIVSCYHDGLLPGTSKSEEGDTYVLLGPEETTSNSHHQQKKEKSLDDTSVMDTTIINNHDQNVIVPSNAGTSTLSRDSKESVAIHESDKEYYIEMNATSNMFVNQAAHEYDDISDEANHVTFSADHVIPDAVNHVTSVEHELDYVVMQGAEPAKAADQKQDST